VEESWKGRVATRGPAGKLGHWWVQTVGAGSSPHCGGVLPDS